MSVCPRTQSRESASASPSVCEDDYKCNVCLDLLRCPVSLECGHTMCLGKVRFYHRYHL